MKLEHKDTSITDIENGKLANQYINLENKIVHALEEKAKLSFGDRWEDSYCTCKDEGYYPVPIPYVRQHSTVYSYLVKPYIESRCLNCGGLYSYPDHFDPQELLDEDFDYRGLQNLDKTDDYLAGVNTPEFRFYRR